MKKLFRNLVVAALLLLGGRDAFAQTAYNLGQDLGFTNTWTAVQTFSSGIIGTPIIGGTATTSDLVLQTTSGVGASGADMHFLVGNNGATEAMTITNAGLVTVNAGLTVSGGQLLATDGTSAAPAYSFSGSTTTGWYRSGAGQLSTGALGVVLVRGASAPVIMLDSNQVTGPGIFIASTYQLAWSSTTAATGTPDVYLLRDAANTPAFRNSTSAQEFRVYKTYTDASNWEMVSLGWQNTANTFTIQTEALGTGTVRNIALLGGNLGVATTAPDKALEVNSATGVNLRLTYNDSNGSAANYTDFATTSTGDLIITPTGTNPMHIIGTATMPLKVTHDKAYSMADNVAVDLFSVVLPTNDTSCGMHISFMYTAATVGSAVAHNGIAIVAIANQAGTLSASTTDSGEVVAGTGCGAACEAWTVGLSGTTATVRANFNNTLSVTGSLKWSILNNTCGTFTRL